jgi:hypothetical protein
MPKLAPSLLRYEGQAKRLNEAEQIKLDADLFDYDQGKLRKHGEFCRYRLMALSFFDLPVLSLNRPKTQPLEVTP